MIKPLSLIALLIIWAFAANAQKLAKEDSVQNSYPTKRPKSFTLSYLARVLFIL
jgi:hypothetical protein